MKAPTEKKAVLQKMSTKKKSLTFFTGRIGLAISINPKWLPGRWWEAVEESPLTHPKLVPSVKVSSYDLRWRMLRWFDFCRSEMRSLFCFDKLGDIYKISPKITKSPQMIAKLTHAKYQISGRHQVQEDLQALAKSKHSVFSETICQSAPHFPLRLGFSGTFGRPTPK